MSRGRRRSPPKQQPSGKDNDEWEIDGRVVGVGQVDGYTRDVVYSLDDYGTPTVLALVPSGKYRARFVRFMDTLLGVSEFKW